MTSATSLTIAGKLTSKALDFGSFLVLARILKPSDFGLVALALTVMLLVEALTEIPLVAPILRQSQPSLDYYDTSFTLGLGRSLALLLAASILGPAMAQFYGEPRLMFLLPFLAVGPVVKSVASPRMADFVRAYNMRPELIIQLSSKTASFLAVVVTATVLRSYWALAVGSVTSAVISSLLSHLFAPYRPRLGMKQWRAFSDVVCWNSASQLLGSLNSYLDRFVLGRVAAVNVVGYYTLATDIAGIPFHGALFPAFGPLTARFAELPKGPELASAWNSALNACLLFLGSPMILLAILSRPTIALVMGDKWLPASELLSIGALAVVPGLIGFLVSPLAIARYRSRSLLERSVITSIISLPTAVYGAVKFGAMGAMVANGIGNTVSAIVALASASMIVDQSFFRQVWNLRRTVVGFFVMAPSTLLVGTLLGLDAASYSSIPSLRLTVSIGFATMVGLLFQGLAMATVWHMEGRPPGVESLIGRQLVVVVRRYRVRIEESID